jgi:long-chain acyl-CoA synthetase
MAGYLNNPQATARAVRGGYLHTGDIGRLDEDGCLYLAGRRDELIIRGGENIYPAEIENVLNAHPEVHESAVVPVPHTMLGSDLIALVVLRPDLEVHERNLLAWCRQSLASFKVPRICRFVKELPKTANGKLRRSMLQRIAKEQS